MPHFKNKNNELFWLAASDDPSVWLTDCVEITDEEATAIKIQNAPKANRADEIKAELNRIDSESVRPARAIAVSMATNAAANEFDIRKLQSLEQQAAALRAELSSIQ
jgi:hypothetical protein